MSVSKSRDKKQLIDALLDQVCDVDLISHFAQYEGEAGLRDLIEVVRDAEFLSEEDLLYNLDVLKKKKAEADSNPMRPVIHRLLTANWKEETKKRPVQPRFNFTRTNEVARETNTNVSLKRTVETAVKLNGHSGHSR